MRVGSRPVTDFRLSALRSPCLVAAFRRGAFARCVDRPASDVPVRCSRPSELSAWLAGWRAADRELMRLTERRRA